jgi:hypothetical protein
MKIQSLLAIAVLAVGLIASAQATTVKAMNLDELSQRSDVILVGIVSEITTKTPQETGSYPETHTTFEVLDVLVGDPKTQEITVSTIGGPAGNGLVTKVPGMPEFRMDEKAVLFLVSDQAKGVSIPTGLSQGVFRVKVDPESQKEYIVNQSVDLGIGDLGTASGQTKGRLGGKGVTLSQFKEIVKHKISKTKEKK